MNRKDLSVVGDVALFVVSIGNTRIRNSDTFITSLRSVSADARPSRTVRVSREVQHRLSIDTCGAPWPDQWHRQPKWVSTQAGRSQIF